MNVKMDVESVHPGGMIDGEKVYSVVLKPASQNTEGLDFKAITITATKSGVRSFMVGESVVLATSPTEDTNEQG